MRSTDYDDVLRPRRTREIASVEAARDLVVEECTTDFCGAVVAADLHAVTLEDRFGARRVFPYAAAGFRLDGQLVTLTRPRRTGPVAPTRTASGSVAVHGGRARVARAGRILVEGVHDAALVERVWGDDLRVEGIAVEPIDGVDHLAAEVVERRPGPTPASVCSSTTSSRAARRPGWWRRSATRTCSCSGTRTWTCGRR